MNGHDVTCGHRDSLMTPQIYVDHWLFPNLSRGAKAVERPEILRLVVTEDVEIAVIGAHAEVGRIGGIPLAILFGNLELPPAKYKAQRPFVGSVPRIAFDAHFAHRASAGGEGTPPRGVSDTFECINFDADGQLGSSERVSDTGATSAPLSLRPSVPVSSSLS